MPCLWRAGRPQDACDGVASDLVVAGRYGTAHGYDPLNGTLQPLRLAAAGDGVRLPGILVRDYPVLIRLGKRAAGTRADKGGKA